MLITSKGLMTLSILLTGMVFLITTCNDDNPIKYNPPIIEVNYPPIDQHPAWSPDGSKIMYYHLGITKINSSGFCTINPDSAGLWIINSDGTNPRLIMKGANIYADWAPDGNWIVFEQRGQIYKAPFINDSIDKVKITQLTFGGRNFFPTWSPDGKWIAFNRSIADTSGPSGVWIMNSDGNQKRYLFGGSLPNWHPNINKLIVVIGSSPTSIWTKFVSFNPFEITASETLNVLINQNNLFPKFSVNGNNIVFQSQAEGEVPQIWRINSFGNNSFKMTDSGGEQPDWSSSDKIVYVRHNYHKWQGIDPSNGTLWIMNSDGTNKQQLTFVPN